MAIMKCQCGANVRVPENAAGAFRCPRCQSMIGVPVAAGSYEGGASEDIAGAATGSTCPICQTTIAAHEAVQTCPTCQQVHHLECWSEVGGCAIYGCESAPKVAKNDDAGPALSAWGDVKACPMCGEQIKAIALKCRYCGANFDTVDPLSVFDLREKVEREAAVKSVRTCAIALFVCSLIPLLAPLTLIIGLIWVLSSRAKLKMAGPVYLVLGFVSIAISALFSVMMLILALVN